MKLDKSIGTYAPAVFVVVGVVEYLNWNVACAFTVDNLKSTASLRLYVVPFLLV